MAYCPSQDWDDYAAAQDGMAQAEIAWWQANKDRVLQVACAMLTNLIVTNEKAGPKEIVDFAAKIVLEITKRSEPS